MQKEAVNKMPIKAKQEKEKEDHGTNKEDRQDRVDKMDKTEFKCGSCLKTVSDQDDGILCEICDNWFHCRCQSVAEPLYKSINMYRKNLHWYCKGCNAGAEKILSVISKVQNKVDKLEDELVRLKTELSNDWERVVKELRGEMFLLDGRVVACEGRIEDGQRQLQSNLGGKLADIEGKIASHGQPKWSDIVSQSEEVKSKLSEVTAGMVEMQQQTKMLVEDKEEQEEINKRKNCVIVHGLEEPVGDAAEDRKKKDEDRIQQMLHELDCDMVSTQSCFRLGKPAQSADATPRPMKLILASEDQKIRLLKNAKNLKSMQDKKLDKVFIHQDLTPRQRERRHQLVLEMKQREANGEKGLRIVNNEIIQRKRQ